MYYYKNRIYSPTLGRFMQTDPVGYPAHQQNGYGEPYPSPCCDPTREDHAAIPNPTTQVAPKANGGSA
jgi:hypothetical protein